MWLTEYSCPQGSAPNVTQELEFNRDFMSWADGQPWLERYAWFTLRLGNASWIGPAASLVGPEGRLTRLGQGYNGQG